ncbi:MAG: hypothetical protein ACYTX0_33260 [Nostoc sp.]
MSYLQQIRRVQYGEALPTKSDRSLWDIDITIDIIPSLCRKMSPHRGRHSGMKAALDATDGNIRKVQKLSNCQNATTRILALGDKTCLCEERDDQVQV